jgi:uncharacterized protein (DUF1778 family)
LAEKAKKNAGGRPPVVPPNPKAATTITLRTAADIKRVFVDAADQVHAPSLQAWIIEAAFEKVRRQQQGV